MNCFKARRGIASLEILGYLIFCDTLMFIILKLIDSYMESKLVTFAIVFFTIWCLYYIVLDLSLKYIFYSDRVVISSFGGLKKVVVKISDINGLLVKDEFIDGFKLFGVGKGRYAFGRMVVKGVGATRAFITSSNKVLYLHTEKFSYAISPKDIDTALTILFDKNIPIQEFETKVNNRELFKDKKFLTPFVLTTILISAMILVPFLLYLTGYLPSEMPSSFDTSFNVLAMGVGKDFAVKQMVTGICNIIILICMYYTSYFAAKYDKKLAVRFIYIAFVISLLFEFLQLQILINYL
ncbi:MAG: PH domain-containing protein [Sarcina sp.]